MKFRGLLRSEDMGILTLRVQTLSYSLSSSSTIALVFEWKDPVKLGLSSSLKPIPEPSGWVSSYSKMHPVA